MHIKLPLETDNILDKYIEDMKTIYMVKTTSISTMDQFIVGVAAIYSLLLLGGFLYWLWIFFAFLAKTRMGKGKVQFKDVEFWKRMGISFAILVLAMSSGVFAFFAYIYDVFVDAGIAS